VTADTFRQRIDLVAADAHWREVMHFVVSALAETNRQSELSVAVTVLDYLNQGEDVNGRHLRNRLGFGAIVAARALKEGVFEQDMKIREQVRHCLEPILASTDVNMLTPLADVRHRHSGLWLRNVLVDCLYKFVEGENIGAAVILGQTLADEDECWDVRQ